MSLFDLSGKVALITGSSRGIGKAIAQQLAAHGARVVISSRKADSCEAAAAGINAAGGSAFAHACHVGHKQELQSLVDATVARWGRIDIVVGNAATNPTFGPSIDTPDEVFEKIIHTNLLSNVWLCNMTLPAMAARRDGAVIIVSSVGGLMGSAHSSGPTVSPRPPTCSSRAIWRSSGDRTTSASTASHPGSSARASRARCGQTRSALRRSRA